jgi:tetratricopeptide (TPR) repeat protein
MTGNQRPARRAPRPGGATANGSLYERYKDALRRGHVAALRGRNEAAADAYGEAASIAPDRALPHASIGGILVRMNRLDDAVAAYERAIALAPRDEGALRGLADVQVRTGLRTEAAATLDRLAETLDAAGRLADATDAARRALELAESRSRREQVEGFAARLRSASSGDEAAQRALDLALRVLEPAAAEGSEPGTIEPVVEDLVAAAEPMETGPADVVVQPDLAHGQALEATAVEPDVEPEPEPESAAEPQPEPEQAAQPESAPEPAALPESAPEPAAQPEPESEPEIVAEPVGLGIALGAAAEAALHAGELATAHDGLLAAARAHRRAGRLSAAVDACYLAIGIAPSDPDLHLLLAELYLDRGWRGQAIEKLLLLGRLADLDDDQSVRDRLCALVTDRLEDEPRVAQLCV